MTYHQPFAEVPLQQRLISERFRLAGVAWANAKREADLLEQMKDPTLEQLKTRKLAELMATDPEKKVSESLLERLVKSSPEWEQFIRGLCYAQEKSNLTWVERRAIELEHSEQIDGNANYRAERKMA
jgi:uncharacterized membrane protein YheB (UPF0754 family)